jgi:hypothetical protein
MDHAGNDVLAGAALAVNQNRNVGGGNFVHAGTQGLHGFGLAEYDGIWGELA